MPFELIINSEHNFIHLTYSGTVDINERISARDKVFKTSIEQNIPRVLDDLSQSNIEMNSNDAINFATAFGKVQLAPNFRLACVTAPKSHTDELLKILISLEGINIKYFIDFKEAKDWLTAV